MAKRTVTTGRQFWRLGLTALVIAVMAAATLQAGATPAQAGQAALSWAAPSTGASSIAGYKVYMGNASRSYQQKIDVGNTTAKTVSNLTDGSTYYFAVTAYDSNGLESAYSNEATKTLPAAPTTYTISASAGTGGTISATNNSNVSVATSGGTTVTSVTVTGGTSQAFAIAASTGYSIADVKVDGTSVGALSSYSFANVTANHTIAATFSASTTTTPTATTNFANRCGATTSYTDSNGVTYAADSGFSGGITSSRTVAISGTADQPLYQTSRYGTNFSYQVPATNGNYQVTLKFAEYTWTAAGQRIFNVAINGQQVLTNFDIYAKAGASNAYDVTIPVSVTNGAINITFTAVVDNAKVDAILIAPAPTVAPGTVMFANRCGATSSYSDSTGVNYGADTAFSGGITSSRSTTISGTADQPLYLTSRYGTNFSYQIPVANGNYQVTLKFAEYTWTAAGQRVFNVAINGQPVLTNFDIFAKAGGSNAYDVVIPVSVSNGAINMAFNAVVDNAKVDAILVKSN